MGSFDMRRGHLAAGTFFMTCLSAGSVQATETGVSFYIPGLRGPLAGIVPSPGFSFQNELYFYDGRIGGARNIEIGGNIVARVKQQARIDCATPIWVTPLEIFGGSLAHRRGDAPRRHRWL